MIKNFMGHLKTINNHKKLVMFTCFKVGMYKQGLLHDLSKYMPVEFGAGIKYYKGYMSPNNAQKKAEGLSTAWLHHKGRNKHHFEYWIDYGSDPTQGLQGMKMPVRYVVEMFIDRMAACMNYEKENYNNNSPLNYYLKGKSHIIMHEESQKLLEKVLEMLSEKGEKETLSYIKNELLK